MIAVHIGLDRLRRDRRIESIERVSHLPPFGAAVPASACPEIATSIVIDAAQARFFIMALFPCRFRIPDRREMRSAP
jgi:hypothetical protein